MKLIGVFILIIFGISITLEQANSHNLEFQDSQAALDGQQLSSNAVNGVSLTNGVVSITQAGTYTLSGTLNGQVSVSVEGKVTLILKGVSIKSTNSHGIIFLRASEIDQNNSLNPNSLSVDFDRVGANIIIADGTENTVNAAKSNEHDGAIHSCVSLLISGETKGDGVLNVIASSEGIETDTHIFINGGIIRIASQDDAINANTENKSIVYIKSGKLLINAGLGQEGDGIDSNGHIIVEGGEIISSARAGMDSGLDSDYTKINGGIVFALGSLLDKASEQSKQPTMNLVFSENIAASSVLTVKDVSGNMIMSYCANEADFISGTERKTYFAAIISHPSFKQNGVYHIFLDGVQMGYTGNKSGFEAGFPNGASPWGGQQNPWGGQQNPWGGQQNPWGGQQNPWGGQNQQNQDSQDIKTDFVLGSSATNFSGVKKAL
jgi:hypothetical protein